MYYKILRGWLRNCDENHSKCSPPAEAPLPTRLIDVGNSSSSSTVRLYETKDRDSMKYLALSALWGGTSLFRTQKHNIQESKLEIDVSKLSSTQVDAIDITRRLGFQYLWIDAICIVQDSVDDVARELTQYERIFDSACCVLAVSSSTSQQTGILREQTPPREFVTFARDGFAPLYVCEFIDNFNDDVLESPLSRRGWFLQERVLARRTIYFTDEQTYWECGDGVRCQTLTKMQK
jgi:Heterokaryon incompatibility protein (HET)